MTNLRKFFRLSLVLALAAAASACQDMNGPGSLSKLNPEAALADYEAMDAVLESSGWQCYQMAVSKLDVTKFGSAPAATVAATAQLRTLAQGDTRAFAAAVAGMTDGVVLNSASLPLISEGNRGKTFVFDANLHDWVADPTRTGAPANGVRFIIYEPKGAEPDPTREIGHADLIDLGDNTAGIGLRLIVVEDELTIVDYRTTLEGSEGEGQITVKGFIQNHRDKLEFDIDVHGKKLAGVEQVDIDFDLGIAKREFAVEGDLHVEKNDLGEDGTIDLLVRHGSRSFRVDIANQNATLSGTIDLNNTLFAKVSGTPDVPVFTTPDGAPVTGANALVLWRMFDITEDVFDLFEDLVEPIAGLIILAVIL
ncbi:MAG TPA: hypothetical protein VK864_11975 [Longimicrobiales bacterium]|nr:hypothetical protein [Longimicrobiales bacterium]